jgi:hypothetical protein
MGTSTSASPRSTPPHHRRRTVGIGCRAMLASVVAPPGRHSGLRIGYAVVTREVALARIVIQHGFVEASSEKWRSSYIPGPGWTKKYSMPQSNRCRAVVAASWSNPQTACSRTAYPHMFHFGHWRRSAPHRVDPARFHHAVVGQFASGPARRTLSIEIYSTCHYPARYDSVAMVPLDAPRSAPLRRRSGQTMRASEDLSVLHSSVEVRRILPLSNTNQQRAFRENTLRRHIHVVWRSFPC